MKQVKVDRAFDETGESWQVAWWNGWKLIWPQTKRVKVDMDMRKNMRKFTSFLIRSNPVCSLVWHPEDFYNILTVRIHMGFRSATSECFEIHLWDSLLLKRPCPHPNRLAWYEKYGAVVVVYQILSNSVLLKDLARMWSFLEPTCHVCLDLVWLNSTASGRICLFTYAHWTIPFNENTLLGNSVHVEAIA